MSPPTHHEQARAAAAAAALLGVPVDASPELLRTAWRAAARHAHPDQGGTPDRFIALTSAYELLTTPPASTPAQATPPTPHPDTPGPAAGRTDITGPGAGGLLVLRVLGLLVAAGVLTAGVAMIAAPAAAAMTALIATATVAHHVHLRPQNHAARDRHQRQ
ncbi:hypothetical protein Ae717Ps2_6476 [Pseudonocardia sp. Ae717_Ps2]|uniref:hypothetical protein n=1 Tax=Pseudonocardia sp. Ae717_Ps2 TaxID=1885573 RepID=UPI00095C54F9|nr:hypothetical protein [Pseudonocardia sp. Ae717_Ps2]OLM28417.1 hypothetical protein Ae717Ps2_6476 [Pseudonocardia sp. Ae717_Ps2]